MFASPKSVALTTIFLLAAGRASATEPTEPLPAPRPLAPALVPVPHHPFPHYSYGRTSKYEVWQNLAVDRFGYFKPVVICSPYGSYYRYDGRPYPWAHNHPLDWMPYVVDPVPFRSPHPYGPHVIYPPAP